MLLHDKENTVSFHPAEADKVEQGEDQGEDEHGIHDGDCCRYIRREINKKDGGQIVDEMEEEGDDERIGCERERGKDQPAEECIGDLREIHMHGGEQKRGEEDTRNLVFRRERAKNEEAAKEFLGQRGDEGICKDLIGEGPRDVDRTIQSEQVGKQGGKRGESDGDRQKEGEEDQVTGPRLPARQNARCLPDVDQARPSIGKEKEKQGANADGKQVRRDVDHGARLFAEEGGEKSGGQADHKIDKGGECRDRSDLFHDDLPFFFGIRLSVCPKSLLRCCHKHITEREKSQ